VAAGEKIMNKAEWISEFQNRKILIWGYGQEGRSSLNWIRFLLPDYPVDIADAGESAALEEARAMKNVRVLKEEETDFGSYDMILKAPGIVFPKDIDPSLITQQSQLFLKHQGFQTVGITGTKGKSTTTKLTHTILSQDRKAHLAGNIGIPCFDILPELKDEDTVLPPA
jgi:UDP-N-acetylmuramoylalanine--D-glutamate ligase